MATTKIWPVKDSLKRVVDYASNPEKTTKDDLEAVIKYAMNGEKTKDKDEHACYVTGINCFADTALNEMLSTQKHFGKSGGNVAYHCYQSFRPGEVTPELCHQLGVELARRMWGDKYQVLVATHLDRDHLHNHLVACSVSFVDGKKFNDNKGAYYRLRRFSDEICLENGLSIIESPLGKTPRQLHFAEKNGEPTRYNLMRNAIDEAISVSTGMDNFINMMKHRGYVVSLDPARKYPTIRSVNSKKSTRLYRLGEKYDLEHIMQRIRDNSLSSVSQAREDWISSQFQPARRQPVKVRKAELKKISGIYAHYLHYLYLMGYRPKRRHKPLSPEMREACRMCDKYSDCAKLMARYHLHTEADVKEFIESSDKQMDALSRERNRIKNRLRREKDPERIDALKADQRRLTGEISQIRKEIKTAKFILDRSEKVRDDIRIELDFCRDDHSRSRKHSRADRDLEC